MTPRDRILLGVVALLGVLAGGWFLVLAPQREEASALATKIAAQEGRRDEALRRVAAGEDARRSFRSDYATVARLGKAVPVDDQVPSLVFGLDRLATRRGVDFRGLKLRSSGSGAPTTVATATQSAAASAPPGSLVGPANLPTLPFDLAFRGPFFNMERFLAGIERYTSTTGSGTTVDVEGRLVTIDGVAVARRLTDPGVVDVSVAATTYVLPPQEGLTAGVGPAGPGSAPAPGGAPAAETTTARRGVRPPVAAVRGATP